MVRSLLLLMVLGLCGCGSESADEVVSETEEDTVFDDQIEAIDKAKAVEDMVMDRKKQLDEAVEEPEEE